MRVWFLALFLVSLASTVLAWTKEDYEIFDLVSALKADGETSFYSFLKVESSATTQEINKAYRRRSLELHPDKNAGVAGAQERFARLGVITAILRDGARRDQYNFFYKNGVPTWKGFGYAYTRWRPTLLHVLAFIALLTTGMHYLVLRMNYTRDRKRVSYFSEGALKIARGAGRRKVRVPMNPDGMGESLELIVEDGNVYLPHDDGSLTSLDELAPLPSIHRTWPFALAHSLIARFKPEQVEVVEEEDESDEVEVEGFAVDTPRARGGRAAQLRMERQKGYKKRESPATSGTATPTEGESEADADTTEAEEGKEGKPRRRGPGKANAARRRKMANKK